MVDIVNQFFSMGTRYPIILYPKGNLMKCGIGILIVNQNFKDPNQNRDGADNDVIYLGRLLEEEFSLELHVYKDLKRRKMNKLLLYLSGKGRDNPRSIYPRLEARHSVLVVAISSHGAKEGIYTSDLKLMKFHKIESFFNPKRCPILIGKPKMFIFNCCRTLEDRVERKEIAFPLAGRGGVEVDGIASDESSEEEIERSEVASEGSDFITVNFCVRGKVSFRHIVHGSLVIKDFLDYFSSNGHKSHFMDTMTGFTRWIKPHICRKMGSAITQCPEVTTTLDRQLYFPEKEQLQTEIPIDDLQLSPAHHPTEVYNAWEEVSTVLQAEEENVPEVGATCQLPLSLIHSSTQQDANEGEAKSYDVFEDNLKRSKHRRFESKTDIRYHPYVKNQSRSKSTSRDSSSNSTSPYHSGRCDGARSTPRPQSL